MTIELAKHLSTLGWGRCCACSTRCAQCFSTPDVQYRQAMYAGCMGCCSLCVLWQGCSMHAAAWPAFHTVCRWPLITCHSRGCPCKWPAMFLRGCVDELCASCTALQVLAQAPLSVLLWAPGFCAQGRLCRLDCCSLLALEAPCITGQSTKSGRATDPVDSG